MAGRAGLCPPHACKRGAPGLRAPPAALFMGWPVILILLSIRWRSCGVVINQFVLFSFVPLETENLKLETFF
jgi:hypothetical protein